MVGCKEEVLTATCVTFLVFILVFIVFILVFLVR